MQEGGRLRRREGGREGGRACLGESGANEVEEGRDEDDQAELPADGFGLVGGCGRVDASIDGHSREGWKEGGRGQGN